MRWMWIDKIESLESGKKACALKNCSLAEEHVHDHFPGFPTHPASLIIEGMAQTAGILVGEARHFEEKVILAKISKAKFYTEAHPGDQLRFYAEIVSVDEAFGRTEGKVYKSIDGNKQAELLAEIDLMFSHIDQNTSGIKFPEENFVFTDQFAQLLRSVDVQ